MKVYALVSGGLPMMALFRQLDLANLNTLAIEAKAYFTENELNRLVHMHRLLQANQRIGFCPVAYIDNGADKNEPTPTLSTFALGALSGAPDRNDIVAGTMISWDIAPALEPGEITQRNYVVSCNQSYYASVSLEPSYEDAIARAAQMVNASHDPEHQAKCSVFIAELKHVVSINQDF